MATQTVFTLSSGRSGTASLSELLRQNAENCAVVHEPYIVGGNFSMFGLPIYDHQARNTDPIRKLLKRKSAAIQRFHQPIYIETSHSFLKSYWDIAHEFFPKMKVFHLVRHPLEVARSEANREAIINRWHLPFCTYRGRDRKRYARWALTGHEPIFKNFNLDELTLFQKYIIQWIEIENRAMEFLNRFDMHGNCLTLHSPHDLNDPQTIPKILNFLKLDTAREEAVLPGVQNRTPGTPTIVGDAERKQFNEVLEKIDDRYLEIFKHAPYSNYPWVSLLHKRKH